MEERRAFPVNSGSIPDSAPQYAALEKLIRVERVRQAHYCLMIGAAVLQHYEKLGYGEAQRDKVLAEIRTALGIKEPVDELETTF